MIVIVGLKAEREGKAASASFLGPAATAGIQIT